jgi:hypothetical protein
VVGRQLGPALSGGGKCPNSHGPTSLAILRDRVKRFEGEPRTHQHLTTKPLKLANQSD